MAIEVITFDLWGTVLWPRDTEVKQQQRMALLLDIAERAGVRLTPEFMLDAWKASFVEAEEETRRTLLEMGPPGRWRMLCRHMGIAEDFLAFDEVEPLYEALTLESPPPLMDGVEHILRAVKAGGYKVGLICNTGVTGGFTIRQVLRIHGVLDYFDTTVFSNEFGRVKPDPAIFHHTWDALGGAEPTRAVHIGDLEELDVDGALNSGAHSLRYVNLDLHEPPAESRARRVFHAWDEFPALLAELESEASNGSAHQP